MSGRAWGSYDDAVRQVPAIDLVTPGRRCPTRAFTACSTVSPAPDLPALSGFGYKQLIQHLRGELSLADAVAETKKETRRFVRRQYAWYALDDPNIMWLNADADAFEKAQATLAAFVNA